MAELFKRPTSARARRESEHRARCGALAAKHTLRAKGRSVGEICEALALAPRTLCHWDARQRENALKPHPRGRPPKPLRDEEREALQAMLLTQSSTINLAAASRAYPEAARRVLHEERTKARREKRRSLHTLVWTRVGALWAADHTQVPIPIDGVDDQLLSVRELAAPMVIAAQACFLADAEDTALRLEQLFDEHGAPLVLKVDNGGALTGAPVRELCVRRGVLQLVSPPFTPEYNGAVEAGIGALKCALHHISIARGMPLRWTSGNLHAAQEYLNGRAGVSRHARTPRDAWEARTRITDDERRSFQETYARFERDERSTRRWDAGVFLRTYEQRSVDRHAITKALLEEGFLLIRKTRVSPDILRAKSARIL